MGALWNSPLLFLVLQENLDSEEKGDPNKSLGSWLRLWSPKWLHWLEMPRAAHVCIGTHVVGVFMKLRAIITTLSVTCALTAAPTWAVCRPFLHGGSDPLVKSKAWKWVTSTQARTWPMVLPKSCSSTQCCSPSSPCCILPSAALAFLLSLHFGCIAAYSPPRSLC